MDNCVKSVLMLTLNSKKSWLLCILSALIIECENEDKMYKTLKLCQILG